ncbi:hypothetical protein ABZP36_007125, partial [Zizania latifolia]
TTDTEERASSERERGSEEGSTRGSPPPLAPPLVLRRRSARRRSIDRSGAVGRSSPRPLPVLRGSRSVPGSFCSINQLASTICDGYHHSSQINYWPCS